MIDPVAGLIYLLDQLMGVLPLLAGLLLVIVANTRRSVRHLQWPMPGLAAVYSTLTLVFLYRFEPAFDGLVQQLTAWVPLLGDRSRTGWLLAIESLVILAGFALTKLLARPVLVRLFQGERFPGSAIVAGLYRHDPGVMRWFLRRRMKGLRAFMRSAYWGSVAVTTVHLVLVEANPAWPGFQATAFPAIAALVVGECYFAINGVTRSEADVLEGEADDADRVADYGALRSVLRETFPDRVLADGVHLASPDATDSKARLDDLARSDMDVDRMGAAYFERVKGAGRPVDTNLVEASVGLTRGTSALINNPFYPDLTEYACFPMYYHLLQNSKCLVICGRDSISDDIASWVEEGLEAISGVPDLWRVDVLTDLEAGDIDVGVLRFADVHNLELIQSNDGFLAEVDYVVLAEPSRMLATGQVGLRLLLSRCGNGRTPVYLAFDRNHDGLVDALSHLLKVDITEVVASALPHGASSDMIWRADGPYMHAAILPHITRYLGVGTEIAAVALKYQVAKVEWIGADKFPVKDMAWIAGQYFGQINQFAELQMSQDALREAFVPNSNPWSLPHTDRRFLIVEDEFSNAYEAVRLYLTRARQQSVVNLISDNYLLRDYMVDNRDIFSSDAKAIPSFAPDFARTERNTVLRIVLTMVAFQLDEAALVQELQLIGTHLASTPATDGLRERPAISALRELITRHTGVTDIPIVQKSRTDQTEADDEAQIQYRISPGSDLDGIVDALKPAYYFVEDESDGAHVIGSSLKGHTQQKLLPGQYVTFGGKHYEVQGIGPSSFEDRVTLRRAAEHIHDRVTYRQLRTSSLSTVRPTDTPDGRRTEDSIEIVHGRADITVSSHGYLEMSSRAALAGTRRVKQDGLPDRHYRNKDVLQIRLPGVPDGVRRTIALLFNELFVTMFPQSHHYLVALTEDPEHDLGDLLAGCISQDSPGAIYIVEDSLVDMGLLVSVHRNWRRLLEIVTDYLTWHTTPPSPPTERPSATGDGARAVQTRR